MTSSAQDKGLWLALLGWILNIAAMCPFLFLRKKKKKKKKKRYIEVVGK